MKTFAAATLFLASAVLSAPIAGNNPVLNLGPNGILAGGSTPLGSAGGVLQKSQPGGTLGVDSGLGDVSLSASDHGLAGGVSGTILGSAGAFTNTGGYSGLDLKDASGKNILHARENPVLNLGPNGLLAGASSSLGSVGGVAQLNKPGGTLGLNSGLGDISASASGNGLAGGLASPLGDGGAYINKGGYAGVDVNAANGDHILHL